VAWKSGLARISQAATNIAPTLQTARLQLRAHRADDFAQFEAMCNDPLVYRYIGGEPMSRDAVWTRLLRYPGHWAMLGFGYWAITLREHDELIGDIGFADYRRAIEPSLDGFAEAGWALASAHHGQGLASEALAAVFEWGEAHLPQRETACLISPENEPSIRLAERFNFQAWTDTEFEGHATRLFRRPLKLA